MTQPNRPKHLAEMTREEVNEGLINSTRAGNIVYSPNDYRNELARRDQQDSADAANAIAARTARFTNRLIAATMFSGLAASASAIAAAWLTISQSHHEAPPPPPPVLITQTALPPAPVTITQTVAPPPELTHP